MADTIALGSYLDNRWQLGTGSVSLINPVTLETLAEVRGDGLDLGTAVQCARSEGRNSLASMTFAERAALLRAMADALQNDRDHYAELARLNSGNTASDVMFDIDGGIAALKFYAGMGKKLGDAKRFVEPEHQPLDRDGHWAARHIMTSVPGIAVHINAFNFPSWGMWEKVAPSLLAGVPAIVKPATAAALVSHAMIRTLTDAKLIPPGVLSLVCGSARTLLDELDAGDVVAFTGSADTAAKLRAHPAVQIRGVRFQAEADSLNSAILGNDQAQGSVTYGLFLREIQKEMTVKAGQKCTAIRRILVPETLLDEVAGDLSVQLAKTTIGDPAAEGVRMGPLQSPEQREAARTGLARLTAVCETVCGGDTPASLAGENVKPDCFLAPTLLLCRDPDSGNAVHDTEVFGPVATLMPYRDLTHAAALVARGKGSLVSSLFTDDDSVASALIDQTAGWHGRLLWVDATLGKHHLGHGTVMPQCIHGGPGRAGGGQELGGLRGLSLYLQRTALQGQTDRLAAITAADAVWPGV